ncbi:MAG: LysR family transcriptional regulator [Gammaproteobacteria bacterium]|nr:MAG: LysR family transcriptional regulator [Gammaproteobacteria bacterium]
MDTGQLTAFIAVAECQSFSKAAEQLHLTQSAISKRVAALENDLDVVLFERFGQRIQLTEAGKILLLDAKEILDKVSQMHDNSDLSKQRVAGKLRVATSHHIGLYRLPKILQGFVRQYPDVQLDMKFMDSEVAYEEVTQGLCDIAVATLPVKTSHSINCTPLWRDELVIMFAKSHAMAGIEYFNINTLADYPAILPDEDTFTRRIIDDVFKDNNIHYRLAFSTNYLETIKVMVEAGLGWSVLPKMMLNNQLSSYPLPGNQPTRTLGVMLHKNKVITPVLRTFIEKLYQFRK